MTLIERIKAESTEFGKLMKTWIAGGMTVVAAVAGLTEYLPILPAIISDVIPLWFKHVVFYSAVVCFLYGHWTVKQKDKPNDKV